MACVSHERLCSQASIQAGMFHFWEIFRFFCQCCKVCSEIINHSMRTCFLFETRGFKNLRAWKMGEIDESRSLEMYPVFEWKGCKCKGLVFSNSYLKRHTGWSRRMGSQMWHKNTTWKSQVVGFSLFFYSGKSYNAFLIKLKSLLYAFYVVSVDLAYELGAHVQPLWCGLENLPGFKFSCS